MADGMEDALVAGARVEECRATNPPAPNKRLAVAAAVATAAPIAAALKQQRQAETHDGDSDGSERTSQKR
jgi:hypothetical protein